MSSQRSERVAGELGVVLDYAKTEAARRHGNFVDVEHLLLGLLRYQSGPAFEFFQRHTVDTDALYARVEESVGMKRPTPAPVKGLSRAAETALERARQEASALQQPFLNPGHLLLGLMGEDTGAVHEALSALPFSAEDARAFLKAGRITAEPSAPRRPSDADGPEFVLVPTRRNRQSQRGSTAARRPAPPGRSLTTSRFEVPNANYWPFILLGTVAFVIAMGVIAPDSRFFTFIFVLVGWIISLTLHEFGHAIVAYWGGDYTVRDKGYLTLNPLKYTHPMTSIVLPLVFIMMGGIGLPGGAVYIERHRLKNQWWGAAVSAAGPAANLLVALILAIPFITGLVDPIKAFYDPASPWRAVAFLALLQISAVFFNLLPIPPLDGFGVIEPFLDARTRQQLRSFGFSGGILLVFFLFWYVPPLNHAFWEMVYDVCDVLKIPGWLAAQGYQFFRFWTNR